MVGSRRVMDGVEEVSLSKWNIWKIGALTGRTGEGSFVSEPVFGSYDSAIFLTAARPLLTAGTRITAQVIAPSAKM